MALICIFLCAIAFILSQKIKVNTKAHCSCAQMIQIWKTVWSTPGIPALRSDSPQSQLEAAFCLKEIIINVKEVQAQYVMTCRCVFLDPVNTGESTTASYSGTKVKVLAGCSHIAGQRQVAAGKKSTNSNYYAGIWTCALWNRIFSILAGVTANTHAVRKTAQENNALPRGMNVCPQAWNETHHWE